MIVFFFAAFSDTVEEKVICIFCPLRTDATAADGPCCFCEMFSFYETLCVTYLILLTWNDFCRCDLPNRTAPRKPLWCGDHFCCQRQHFLWTLVVEFIYVVSPQTAAACFTATNTPTLTPTPTPSTSPTSSRMHNTGICSRLHLFWGHLWVEWRRV